MKIFLAAALLFISIQSTAQSKPIPDRVGWFKPGTKFAKDTKYYSEDKRYFLQFQSDGNLVVYKVVSTRSANPVWNSRTNGRAASGCVFQQDGNLVLYDYNADPVWNAFTDANNRNNAGPRRFAPRGTVFVAQEQPYMVMQNDGNLVIYSGPYPKRTSIIWATESFERN